MRTTVSLLSFAFLSCVVFADESPSSASSRLDVIKQLAGDWVQVGDDGQPTDRVISSIRVTSGGSAVHETLFPGTPKEMITMYYVDGPHLVLTHYCVLGNQPHMRAEVGTDANRLLFKCIGGGNVDPASDNHMNQGTITIVSKDRFTSEWVRCDGGKACETVKFDLVRRK